MSNECLLNRLFRRRSKKTSKLRATGLFEGNSPVTGEFLAQRASNAENGNIWWRHHDDTFYATLYDHYFNQHVMCQWISTRKFLMDTTFDIVAAFQDATYFYKQSKS